MNDRRISRLTAPSIISSATISTIEEDISPSKPARPQSVRFSSQAGAELLACLLMLLLTGAVLAAMCFTAGTVWSLFFSPYLL